MTRGEENDWDWMNENAMILSEFENWLRADLV